MAERPGAITMKGNPLTLVGEQLKVGDPAPDATLVSNDLSEVKLASFTGRVRIICAVPSLDTPVCDAQTRRFNQEAAALGDDVAILTISADLPFAQARWCASAGVDKVQTLSDHRDTSFGDAYGVRIKELRLLARSVFVVDKDGRISYIQIVPELTDEPDYQAALDAARQVM